MLKGILIFSFILYPFFSYAQIYKGWFINQSEVNCKMVSVGYAEHSYFRDTAAVKRAFISACRNFVMDKSTKIKGSEAFWVTGIGTYDMGNNFKGIYDTSRVKYYEKKFVVLDTLNEGGFVSVLAGNRGCKPNMHIFKRENMDSLKAPSWIENPPKSDEYDYSVGASPAYYYEKSSWLEAENSARLKLAFSISMNIESLQMMNFDNGISQSIENESITVNLHNLKVISRWKDKKNDIFYVLIRMSKY